MILCRSPPLPPAYPFLPVLLVLLFFNPLMIYAWAYTVTMEHIGTDKPVVMKMNVPTCPLELYYEVYFSGARCQVPGPVLLSPGLLGWNLTANQSSSCPSRVKKNNNPETTYLFSVIFCFFCFCFFSPCSCLYQIKKCLSLYILWGGAQKIKKQGESRQWKPGR